MPVLSVLVVVPGAATDGLPARLRGLQARFDGCCDNELLVVAHGALDEDLPQQLREACIGNPRLRVLLHSRRVSAHEAMLAGVGNARAPTILLLADDARMQATWEAERWMPARLHANGLDCAFANPRDPILFSRHAFLELPCIPGMRHLLPELFARRHRARRNVSATPTRSPNFGSVGRWLTRTWVWLACTMVATGARPAS